MVLSLCKLVGDALGRSGAWVFCAFVILDKYCTATNSLKHAIACRSTANFFPACSRHAGHTMCSLVLNRRPMQPDHPLD